MKVLVAAALILLVLVFLFKSQLDRPQLRGTAKESATAPTVLMSNGRPAVALVPTVELDFISAAMADLAPDTTETRPGNARIWYSTYGSSSSNGWLMLALAEAQDPWQWSQGYNSAGRPIREDKQSHKSHTVYETLLIQRPEDDLFSSSPLEEYAVCLVHRAVIMMNFNQMKLIAEYHERILPEDAHTVQYDLPVLNAFQQRARKSFNILFRDSRGDGEQLPKDITKLANAPSKVSRIKLARWTGKQHQKGDL